MPYTGDYDKAPARRTIPVPQTALVTASVTRPADTTAYATGDALTNSTSAPVPLTFAGCARDAGGSGRVRFVRVVDSANQASKATLELWLFAATVTADNDNAVFTPTDAECATLVGVIALGTPVVGDATSGAGGNAVYLVDALDRGFVCATGSMDLYGLLVVRSAYTPISAEVFTVTLDIRQD